MPLTIRRGSAKKSRRSRSVLLTSTGLLSLAVGGALLGTTTGQAAMSGLTSTAQVIGPLSPPSGAWFGAMTNEDKTNPDGTRTEVKNLETAIGRKLAIDHRFYTYNEPFSTLPDENWDWNNGRLSMVTWGAADTWNYLNGSQDGWVKQQADSLAAFGHPIFLRFYHEMDADSRQPLVHSATDYIAAWRYVHKIFIAEGATNVVWVWCPTAWKFNTQKPWPPDYYPGDAYVDWIGADGYNWYPAKPTAKWRTFYQVFENFYAWAATRTKPIMVSEYGVLNDPSMPTRKADWIGAIPSTLGTSFPKIEAINYFDTSVTKGGVTYDWRLTSPTNATSAWAAIGADPYLSTMYNTTGG